MRSCVFSVFLLKYIASDAIQSEGSSRSWPDGMYTLLKSETGCPTTSCGPNWIDNNTLQFTTSESSNSVLGNALHFAGDFSKNHIELQFCDKQCDHCSDSADCQGHTHWPQGQYCIFPQNFVCPLGFYNSLLRMDVALGSYHTVGQLPVKISKTQATARIVIYFCCRSDGDAKEPIILPTDKSFYLLALSSFPCQQVAGMTHIEEPIHWIAEESIPDTYPITSPVNTTDGIDITFCYYSKPVLSASSGSFSQPPLIALMSLLLVVLVPICVILCIKHQIARREYNAAVSPNVQDSLMVSPDGYRQEESQRKYTSDQRYTQSWETCDHSFEATTDTFPDLVDETSIISAQPITSAKPKPTVHVGSVASEMYDDVVIDKTSSQGKPGSGESYYDDTVATSNVSPAKHMFIGSEYDDTANCCSTARSPNVRPQVSSDVYDDVVSVPAGANKSKLPLPIPNVHSSDSTSRLAGTHVSRPYHSYSNVVPTTEWNRTNVSNPAVHQDYQEAEDAAKVVDRDQQQANSYTYVTSDFNKARKLAAQRLKMRSKHLYHLLESIEANKYCNPADVQELLTSPIYDVVVFDDCAKDCPDVEIFAELPVPYEIPVQTRSIGYEHVDSIEEGDVQLYDQPLHSNVRGKPSKQFKPPPAVRDTLYHIIEASSCRFTLRDFEIGEPVGEGNFSTVYVGTWHSPKGSQKVAVKRLKDTSYHDVIVNILQEAAIMVQLRHNNVVKLVGIHVGFEGAPTIFMELLSNGDLKNYLRNCKDRLLGGTTSDEAMCLKILNYATQVASGMNYLSNKGLVHRDLAARNVFLDNSFICKIGDFGMSRQLAENGYYKQTKRALVPLKWTAPEALAYKKYSPASDAWSYGCLLYEMWSLGTNPLSTLMIQDIFPRLITGYRDPPPPGCPKSFYRLMIACWHPSTAKRPLFDKIHLLLQSVNKGLLMWNDRDRAGIDFATFKLGGPFSEGQDVFMELQNVYRNDTYMESFY